MFFRLTSLTEDSTQEWYTETDISTTALQYIDLVSKKPEYESLNNEQDRAKPPGECDALICVIVIMHFDAGYLIDSMRTPAGAA